MRVRVNCSMPVHLGNLMLVPGQEYTIDDDQEAMADRAKLFDTDVLEEIPEAKPASKSAKPPAPTPPPPPPL